MLVSKSPHHLLRFVAISCNVKEGEDIYGADKEKTRHA